MPTRVPSRQGTRIAGQRLERHGAALVELAHRLHTLDQHPHPHGAIGQGRAHAAEQSAGAGSAAPPPPASVLIKPASTPAPSMAAASQGSDRYSMGGLAQATKGAGYDVNRVRTKQEIPTAPNYCGSLPASDPRPDPGSVSAMTLSDPEAASTIQRDRRWRAGPGCQARCKGNASRLASLSGVPLRALVAFGREFIPSAIWDKGGDGLSPISALR